MSPSAIMSREDGIHVIEVGDTVTNTTDEGPEPRSVFAFGRCGDCDEVVILEAGFEQVAAYEREMGAEREYSTRFHQHCQNCEAELEAEIRYSEYPRGPVDVFEFDTINNVEYEPINGLEHFVSQIQD